MILNIGAALLHHSVQQDNEMGRTLNLRRQHDAAMDLVDQISRQTAKMGVAPSRDQAFGVSLLLGRLAGMLKIHFAQEDKFLYPVLIAAGNDTADIAKRFAKEMGDIGPAFDAFVDRWANADAIHDHPAAFSYDSSQIFQALGKRIKRENEILFPLAEQATLAATPHVA